MEVLRFTGQIWQRNIGQEAFGDWIDLARRNDVAVEREAGAGIKYLHGQTGVCSAPNGSIGKIPESLLDRWHGREHVIWILRMVPVV